jgi:hypothetical protein
MAPQRQPERPRPGVILAQSIADEMPEEIWGFPTPVTPEQGQTPTFVARSDTQEGTSGAEIGYLSS